MSELAWLTGDLIRSCFAEMIGDEDAHVADELFAAAGLSFERAAFGARRYARAQRARGVAMDDQAAMYVAAGYLIAATDFIRPSGSVQEEH